ncbi:hypothetical protein BGX28_001335, partial [Mortierella sp. GBA30]
MSVPSCHIDWALEKKAGKEHVLLPNFVRKFEFTDKDSANRAFSALIGSNNLRQSRRLNLQRLFTEFQQNLEESFWTDHTLKISTNITTKQTATAVQKSGTKQAQVEYQRFIARLDKDASFEEYKDDPDDDASVNEAE